MLAITIAGCGRIAFDPFGADGAGRDAASSDGVGNDGEANDAATGDAGPMPVRVSVTSGSAQTGGTSIATVGADFAAGNLVVVLVHWSAGGVDITSVTDSAGNTYASVIRYTNPAGGVVGMHYANNIIAGNGVVITATFSAATTFRRITAIQYAGGISGNPFDGAVGAFGMSGTASTTTPVTVSGGRAILVADCFARANQTGGFTPGPGYNEIVEVAQDSATEDVLVSANGDYQASMSLSVATDWIIVLGAFKAL